MEIRKPTAELKAYILWEGKWRHVYIISGYDQQTLLGKPERMLEFKLTKTSRITFAAPKSQFHQKKPKKGMTRKGDLA